MKTDEEWISIWNNRWKDNFRDNLEESWDFRNKFMVIFLEEVLTNAKEQYYNTDTDIMTDKMYDRFERFLAHLDPKSKLLDKVGG